MNFEDGRLGLPSASKAERWLNCNGSWHLEALIPEQESGPDAKRGERIHLALAENKIADLVSADEVETAEILQELEKKAVEAFKLEVSQSDEGFDGKLIYVREQRLTLKTGSEPMMTGKPDVVCHTSGITRRGLIIDYKTGQGIVPTEKSHQLQIGRAHV